MVRRLKAVEGFKAGVFRRYQASKAALHCWDKIKTQYLSLKMVFEVVPAFVPEADETRRRVIPAAHFGCRRKAGCSWVTRRNYNHRVGIDKVPVGVLYGAICIYMGILKTG